MNNPCRLRRLRPLPDTPLPHLIRTGGEETRETQRGSHNDDDLADCALDAEFLAFFGGFFVGHASETFFECYRERDDDVAGAVFVDPGFDLGKVFVLLADVVFFGEVDEEDYGLGGEKHEAVDDFDLVGVSEGLVSVWMRRE